MAIELTKTDEEPTLEEAKLMITTNVKVIAHLKKLESTGLFGLSIENVAEQLICWQLQRLINEDWISV